MLPTIYPNYDFWYHFHHILITENKYLRSAHQSHIFCCVCIYTNLIFQFTIVSVHKMLCNFYANKIVLSLVIGFKGDLWIYTNNLRANCLPENTSCSQEVVKCLVPKNTVRCVRLPILTYAKFNTPIIDHRKGNPQINRQTCSITKNPIVTCHRVFRSLIPVTVDTGWPEIPTIMAVFINQIPALQFSY